VRKGSSRSGGPTETASLRNGAERGGADSLPLPSSFRETEMGYETRIHVVSINRWDKEVPQSGQELASIDLCKCGDGEVGKLVRSYTKSDGSPKFALWARNPDRQHEVVEFLRETAEADSDPKKNARIEKLADDIEDGKVTRDRYGDLLGLISIDDFITALEKDCEKKMPYRRYVWALALLRSIRQSWDTPEELRVVTYGY
jgi:hypothetical protein